MSAKRRLYVVLVAVAVSAVVIAFATLRGTRYACVSFEQGLHGEAKRGPDGQFLYFNGQCWTRQPLAPTDTPF